MEPSPADAEVIAGLLRGDDSEKIPFEISFACTLKDAFVHLSGVPFDVVLVNLAIDLDAGYDSLGQIRERCAGRPIIVIAEAYDETVASMVVGSGAQDFLVKDRLDSHMLIHSVKYGIQRFNMFSELEQRVKEFQAGEARLLNLIVNNVDGILVVDRSGVVRFVNPAAERLFCQTRGTMLGNPFGYPIDPGESREISVKGEGGESSFVEYRVVGTTWEGTAANLVSVRDISPRKKAERVLRESEERYALAIRGAQEGVWDWNLLADTVYYGQQWKEILGCSASEIGTSPNEWFSRIHPEDVDKVKAGLDAHLAGTEPVFEYEYRIGHRDGTWRWVFCRGSAVRDQNGRAYRIAGSQTDITARKTAEGGLKRALSDLQFALASEKVLMEELDRKNRELIELSITDGLTRLFNHRFLQERFDFEFKRVKRYGGTLSCMMIDIDHFKKLNDTYGHQFGDIVLRKVADLLTENSREVDICGRYGGEEFMILSNQTAERAMKHATKVHKSIDENVFEHEGQKVHVTVSIGISEYRNEVKTKQELIDRADDALYEAKEGGRNLIRTWKEKDQDEQVPLDRYSIQSLKTQFVNLSNDVRATYIDSTNALVKAVEAKDPYTQAHAANVADYAVRLSRFLGLPEPEVEIIKYAALLHDVGKIGVPQEILTKTTPLTDGEYELLKKHPVIGVTILKDVKFLEREVPLILHHHERYDGSGYPQGLKGREIPLGALILGVIDAFEAMTAGRTYRNSMTIEQAVKELQDGRGTQFAPDIAEAFVEMLKCEGRLSRKGVENAVETAEAGRED